MFAPEAIAQYNPRLNANQVASLANDLLNCDQKVSSSAPWQVWEKHPVVSQYADLSDREIAVAIDLANGDLVIQVEQPQPALTIVPEQVTIHKGGEPRPAQELYAHKGSKRIGKIINTVSPGLTGLTENPNESPKLFAAVYSGHGDIYHQPKSGWGEIFSNPQLLPTGTTNIFIDEAA